MKLIRIVVLCAAPLTAVPTFAQGKSADTNMQILLDKVKAEHLALINQPRVRHETDGGLPTPTPGPSEHEHKRKKK